MPVLTGTQNPAALAVISASAEKNQSQLFITGQSRVFKYQTETIQHTAILRYHNLEADKDESWEIDLLGSYQNENLSSALQTVEILAQQGWKFSLTDTKKGLSEIAKNTGIRGRWEIIGTNPKIICDTGHNEDGIRVLMEQLMHVPAKKLHMIWGMVNDKSPEQILPLLPKDASYYFTAASIPRAMDPQELGAKARAMGLKGNDYNDVKTALKAALETAEKEDVIFIGGSTFIVADALA